MLADSTLLANLAQNLTLVNETLRQGPHGFRWGLDKTYPSFDLSQSASVNLGVFSAVISTNYLCQKPQRNNPGTLFFSISVADLVLLQSIWLVFKLVVDTFWVEKRVELRSCEGCTSDSRELEALNESRSSSNEDLVAHPPGAPTTRIGFSALSGHPE
jgi:hypothetical protein